MNEGGGLTAWLTAAGAPEAMAARIGRALGADADERVTADPWCVLEVPGVAPQAADALARVVLDTAEPTDPRRTRALISWLLRRAGAAGSTVQGADVIAAALGTFGVPDATGAIADAIEHGAALAFAEPISLSEDADEEEIEDFEQQDAQDDDDPAAMLTSARTLLAVERWAFAEQAAAEAAQRLAATPEAVEAKQDADAADALVGAVVEHGLTLVTGAGARQLADLVAAFPSTLLATPSAAGLRTLAAAGAEALDARMLAEQPGRIGAADVIVIADAQLVGIELGATLLEAARDGAHVVLAGDAATLPGAAAGLLFRDLLEIDDPEFGGRLPRVELKRRPTGPLSSLSDAVRYGGLPPQELLVGPDGTSKEVVIVPVREAREAVHRAVQVAADSIPRAFGLTGQQVQVVAVGAELAAGTGPLNAALKQRLNPGTGACEGFDAGDRVIVAVPLPERGLFGGETGTVDRADADGLTVIWDPPHKTGDVLPGGVGASGAVSAADASGALEEALAESDDEDAAADFDPAETDPVEGADDAARAAEVDPAKGRGTGTGQDSGGETGAGQDGGDGSGNGQEGSGAGEGGSADTFAAAEVRALRHAWALTIGEAQGGRWPAVVAVFDGESAPKLSRALVLGAITLATQHLTVVHGAGRALSEAVEKIPDRPRRTRLKYALRE